MEENQITKQNSTMKLENLFKHNIFFTPVNEDRTYISNYNFSINVTYVTKKIMLRKQNIKQLEDLLDQIDHFFFFFFFFFFFYFWRVNTKSTKKTINMKLFLK